MGYIFSWPVVYSYSAVIFVFSILPLKGPEELGVPFIDKAIHFLVYCLLSVIVANLLFLKQKSRPHLFSFLYAFTLGSFIEIMHFFLPYRSFEGGDIFFNVLGAVLGCVFIYEKRS